jgi:hypothetical protein
MRDQSNPVGLMYIIFQLIERQTLFWKMLDLEMTHQNRQWVLNQMAQFIGE